MLYARRRAVVHPPSEARTAARVTAQPPKTSIILTTYNRPDALRLVLLALGTQTHPPHEVIVADDGSGQETERLILSLQTQLQYPLHRVWQEDEGFRAARIRNRAVLQATGDYLIFLDGDCVPFPDFVRRHQALAELGWFVSGHRVLLSQTFTEYVLSHDSTIDHTTTLQWIKYYLVRHSNRLLPLLRLDLTAWRKFRARRWQGAKSCNLGVWRLDFCRVGGFDEGFTGWGYEDSDLVIRLIRSGVFRKSGKFALPVLHLWHAQADRHDKEANWHRLQALQKSPRIRADIGID